MWTIDILSDSYIKDNIIEIGILQYLHHLIGIFNFGVLFLLFFSNSTNMLITSVIISIVSQIGWLYNNDLCWLFTYVNKKIDSNRPKRKWRAELYSFIKHYIRGDSWGFSDINVINMEGCSNFTNIITIFCLIKKILLNTK
jgi:hypothetical protein